MSVFNKLYISFLNSILSLFMLSNIRSAIEEFLLPSRARLCASSALSFSNSASVITGFSPDLTIVSASVFRTVSSAEFFVAVSKDSAFFCSVFVNIFSASFDLPVISAVSCIFVLSPRLVTSPSGETSSYPLSDFLTL